MLLAVRWMQQLSAKIGREAGADDAPLMLKIELAANQLSVCNERGWQPVCLQHPRRIHLHLHLAQTWQIAAAAPKELQCYLPWWPGLQCDHSHAYRRACNGWQCRHTLQTRSGLSNVQTYRTLLVAGVLGSLSAGIADIFFKLPLVKHNYAWAGSVSAGKRLLGAKPAAQQLQAS